MFLQTLSSAMVWLTGSPAGANLAAPASNSFVCKLGGLVYTISTTSTTLFLFLHFYSTIRCSIDEVVYLCRTAVLNTSFLPPTCPFKSHKTSLHSRALGRLTKITTGDLEIPTATPTALQKEASYQS